MLRSGRGVRRVAFATAHHKASLVRPALEPLGFEIVEVSTIDTDALGTFTGSVARRGTDLDAARAKAMAALEAHPQAEFGLGSEGTFGSSAVPWLSTDREVLLLRARSGHELVARVESLDTNWRTAHVESEAQLRAFASSVGFPEQALVVDGHRGLTDLNQACALLKTGGATLVMPDVRAHLNAPRRRVITACALRLADLWRSRCPACGLPGFAEVPGQSGLRCEACHTPTRLARTMVARCSCGFERSRDVAGAAPAAQCDDCNP